MRLEAVLRDGIPMDWSEAMGLGLGLGPGE